MADRLKFGDIDLGGSAVGGTLERTIEGASTVTLAVRDPARRLLRQVTSDVDDSGRLNVDDLLVIDGLKYALVKVALRGDEFEYVFEDRVVAQLRAANATRKVRRGDVTRAQFVRSLVESVRPKPPFFAPEINMPQPRAELPRADRENVEKSQANPGFDRQVAIRVKGQRADAEQLRILEIAMAESDDLDAPTQARKALVMALIQESSARDLNYSGDGLSEGPLQLTYATSRALGISQHDIPAQIREFLRNGFWRYRPRGAIELARETSMGAGDIAQACQGSAGSGSDYAKWAGEADNIVASWGGGSTRAERGGTVTYERDYYFSVGKPRGPKGEDYWEATGRMAEEVGRRRFVTQGEFWWISEEDLFARPSVKTISEDSAGIDRIEFDLDNGKRVKELTVACRIDRWAGGPGGIVRVKDLGPADGKWLISSISRDLFTEDATVTLRKPIKERREPRGELVTRSVDAREPEAAGGTGDAGPDPNFKGGRGAFLWPTPEGYRNIYSPYGPRGGRLHAGIDISPLPVGSLIRASAAGRCRRLSDPGGYGTYLIVDHGNGWETRYAHLSSVEKLGQVKAGEVIAKSGGAAGAPGSGNSQGPHLHYEIRRNGAAADPGTYL